MCGSTEIIPSVAMFYSGLNTDEREICSGRYRVWFFLECKAEKPAYRRAARGTNFPLQQILHLSTKKSFYFIWVMKNFVINVKDQGVTKPV
jgi:hypothetical protein